MDFDNASHGVSFNGMSKYKDELHMNVFKKIRDAINNTSEVSAAVKNGWTGTAADNFISNLQTGANRLSTEMDKCEEMVITELDGIMSQIGDMDEKLVELEGDN